jgi:non-ribosomal peptide synthetase component E (peptide arylation enzyme)
MDDTGARSYRNGPADQPLIGETIGANLERTAAAFGDREALVDVPSGRRWTYAELNEATDVFAAALIASGVAAGDRVGIWAPNCPEWVLLQYATAKIGAILVAQGAGLHHSPGRAEFPFRRHRGRPLLRDGTRPHCRPLLES